MKKLYSFSNAKLLVVLSLIIFSYLTGKCQNTTHNLFPANGFASIAFEDLWPAKGDYDMNDIVVDCKFDQITNSDNKVTQIQAQIVLRAMGASFHNGFGIQLPVTPDKVSGCVVKFDNGEAVPISGLVSIDSKGLEQGQDKAVVILFDDGFLVLPQNYPGIGVNTAHVNPWTETRTINMTLTFSEPIDPNILVAPYNPFIFANSQRGAEIHLPNCAPTSLANKSLFKTLDDDSNVSTFTNPSSIRSYLTKDNLPWAIFFYKRFDYPIEKAPILDAYHHFAEWAQSDGSAYPDWYFNLASGYRDDSKIYLHAPSLTTPSVSTSAITSITTTTASAGGNVSSDGGSTVTARGICWGTLANPTIVNSNSTVGTGTGSFTSNITGLTSNSNYFVRAYATNSSGTVYGTQQTFSTLSDGITFTLNTLPVTNILATTALARADVTNDGGLPVTSRGICWSTAISPTTADSKTIEGSGLGQFTSNLTGLTPNTTYYVRGYATSGLITVYGNELSFKTAANIPIIFNPNLTYGTVTDVEENVYKTITIGTQTWMAENLRATKFNDGSEIPLVIDNTAWSNLNIPGFCFYNNDEATNKMTYGALYNWYAVNTGKLAPAGWHVPSSSEWTTLINFLGGINIAGGKLKETGTTHFISPNLSATNESGFTGLPGGFRHNSSGIFYWSGVLDYWWSTAADPQTDWPCGIQYNEENILNIFMSKTHGLSVRCIKDNISSSIVPIVNTVNVTSIASNTSVSGGNITSDGGASVNARGVCWSITHNPTVDNSKTTDGTGTGLFISNITGLAPLTTYYVRAYATNSTGTAYGEELSFATTQPITPPGVNTTSATATSSTTATAVGFVAMDGGNHITRMGICYSSIYSQPSLADNVIATDIVMGSYTVNLTGLTPSTTYYVRAFATNSVGTTYGGSAAISFTTPASINVPILPVSTPAINITSTTASAGSAVPFEGGAPVTDKGICYSTSPVPTIANSKVSGGTGIGGFMVVLTGLTPNTKYYFRAYATNSAGTAYNDEASFTTLQNITSPSLTTSAITSITTTTASSGGNVTDDGGATIIARGVCWSVNQNPSITDNKTSDGTGTGVFNSNVAGLTANTTYYIRAYATNNAGISYGPQQTLLTSPTTPTLTTLIVTSITATSAFSGGNITSDGGSKILARGVCWSMAPNPTLADFKTDMFLTGTGIYISDMSWLTASTTYYVRAYATNSIGTSYGTQQTFVTLFGNPSVSTVNIKNITSSNASVEGLMVYTNGTQENYTYGFCWSTTENPTLSNTNYKTAANATLNGNLSFTNSIIDLHPNTTYFVSAYATNSASTFYGVQKVFSTAVGTNFNSNLTYGTVTDIDGNVYKTITIGTQTWMAENLKTTKYRNGDPIQSVTDNNWINFSAGAYCNYANDIKYTTTYGCLYNWNAVIDNRNIAPTGWHIASDAEWTTLVNYLGGASVAGNKLKEVGPLHWPNGNASATNESGFTALPGGDRTDGGGFGYVATYGYWWTPSGSNAYNCAMSFNDSALTLRVSGGTNGFMDYVRCVKDF